MKNKYDLIVVGGGFAGTAAAIAAAKQGVDVLLIERYNCLGGAASSALVSPFMWYWSVMPDTKERTYLSGNLFREMVDEMNLITDKKPTYDLFDEELLKLVLNRMAIKYGVTLLFHTTVTGVSVENGTITDLTAVSKTNELHFTADYYIDATGDGELSVLAGCEFKLGREKDQLCQPMTLCFRMSGIDKKTFRKNENKMNETYRALQKEGLIKNPRENILFFENVNSDILHFNTTRIIKKDPTDPFALTEAEIEAREQVFEMQKFLREHVEGCENARVIATAMHIGIRESRKIVGEYTITEDDCLALARFDDAIAVSNYAIDIHNPEGTGTHFHEFQGGEWFQIPYRSILPKGMNNLLVAGRCISSTHEAQASYRIMPFCAELGQAAGTAVAVAKENNTDTRKVDIHQLQKRLREEGFVI